MEHAAPFLSAGSPLERSSSPPLESLSSQLNGADYTSEVALASSQTRRSPNHIYSESEGGISLSIVHRNCRVLASRAGQGSRRSGRPATCTCHDQLQLTTLIRTQESRICSGHRSRDSSLADQLLIIPTRLPAPMWPLRSTPFRAGAPSYLALANPHARMHAHAHIATLLGHASGGSVAAPAGLACLAVAGD